MLLNDVGFIKCCNYLITTVSISLMLLIKKITGKGKGAALLHIICLKNNLNLKSY
jgi:hypothetical protein